MSALPPLPPNWTEHVAPTGHLYWYHELTGESTYTRPGTAAQIPAGSKIDPTTGKLIVPEPAASSQPAKKKKEKPRDKEPIEGTDWIRVTTTEDNVFFMNKATKQSTWTVPDELVEWEAARQKRIEEEQQQTATALKRKAEEDVDDKIASVSETATAQEAERAEEEQPKKPKKKKPKVVHSLADIEDPELRAAMLEQIEEESHKVEEVSIFSAEMAAAEQAKKEPDLTTEEAAALFKAMLSEKDIKPLAPWEMELPKFVNDPRYTAVKHLGDRRALFDEFCKEKIREQRIQKQAAGYEKPDPTTAYKTLLRTNVTSTRTHWEDFRSKFKKDQRFREFGKDDREREKAFKAWLRELGEIKRADAQKAESMFRALLAEHVSADSEESWSQVKTRIADDPRYSAIKSSSQREGLFNDFKKELSAAPRATPIVDPEAARKEAQARREKALAQRQAEVEKQKVVNEKRAFVSRSGADRVEAEREFRSLLIDAVRSHVATWEGVQPGLSKDSRYSLPGLTDHRRRELFDEHIANLSSKRKDSVETLFEKHAPQLDTPFTKVYAQISEEPQVKRLGSMTELEHTYSVWQRRRKTKAYDDLIELLKENSFVDFWGRLRKEGDKSEQPGVQGFGDAEGAEEKDEDQVNVKQMSKQVDLNQIKAVLKHDKRFQILDSDPEQRDVWIQNYLENMEAPKQTVHQRQAAA